MKTMINIENEISDLASSIRRNMVDPAEQRLEEIHIRLLETERSINFLTRAFFAASIIFAVTMGTMLYYMSTR